MCQLLLRLLLLDAPPLRFRHSLLRLPPLLPLLALPLLCGEGNDRGDGFLPFLSVCLKPKPEGMLFARRCHDEQVVVWGRSRGPLFAGVFRGRGGG